ncbi:hypothetical protein EVAR_50723_1 [Eumeta japonica]|uniref:Uncharacterized protein n=1 Tax=Eumeta variegata TaxID=151549 RepID=A0A4C1YQT4_EUMVA|nr:hypothetical protein EVAR_50723_1 [Eumeta japonica]
MCKDLLQGCPFLSVLVYFSAVWTCSFYFILPPCGVSTSSVHGRRRSEYVVARRPDRLAAADNARAGKNGSLTATRHRLVNCVLRRARTPPIEDETYYLSSSSCE